MTSGEFNMSGSSTVRATGSSVGLSVGGGTANISGGTITGSTTAVSVTGGEVTIAGLSLTASGSDTIQIGNGGTVTLNGTTVTQSNTSYYAVAFTGTTGTLNIGAGTSITGGKGLQIPSGSTVNLTGVPSSIEVTPEGYSWGSESPVAITAESEYATDSVSKFSYTGGTVAGFYVDGKVVYIWDAYTVTFVYNNGTGTQTEQTVVKGRTAVEPDDPSYSGHTFTGWYANGATDPYNFNTEVTSDFTLTAGWTEEAVYTVSYDPNGKEGVAVERTVKVGEGFTAIENPFDTGYEFLGWSTDKSATIAEYNIGDTVDKGTSEGEILTLYAVWGSETDPIVIEFLPNGGSGTIASVTIDIGGSVTMPSSGFTRSGYEFAGWALESGGDAVFGAGQTVTYDEIVEVSSSTDLTLYAVWEKSPTVIIDPSMDDRRGTTVTTTTSGSDTDSTKVLAVAAAAAAAAVMAAFIALGLRKD